MPKSRKQWGASPKKPASPKPSDATKQEVETKADALIESVLKPRYVEPPPDEPRFNYIIDLFTKWHGRYFYFCSRYASPGPTAIQPFFEDRFARMEYAGSERFNLAFMRHTGQWIEIYSQLTLDECLDAVQDDPWFQLA